MTLSIEVDTRPDHLVFVWTGSYVQDAALKAYEQAFAMAGDAGLRVVLIDSRQLTGPVPTTVERVNAALFIAGLQARQHPKIRSAVLGKEPIVDRHRLGEIVATARGAVARVFTDEQQALDWLLRGIPASKGRGVVRD